MSPERLPEATRIETMRQSLVELNGLIEAQEQKLASDPNCLSYQFDLSGSQRRWEELSGMKRIPLSYKGTFPHSVAQLLGARGFTMLGEICGIVNLAAVEGKWPLEALEVHRQTDPEIEDKDMKSVVLVLKLRTSFDEADKMLKSLYPKLETHYPPGTADWSVLAKDIDFDIEPVAPPEPSDSTRQ